MASPCRPCLACSEGELHIHGTGPGRVGLVGRLALAKVGIDIAGYSGGRFSFSGNWSELHPSGEGQRSAIDKICLRGGLAIGRAR
jgi:hypothetical protein